MGRFPHHVRSRRDAVEHARVVASIARCKCLSSAACGASLYLEYGSGVEVWFDLPDVWERRNHMLFYASLQWHCVLARMTMWYY